MPDLQLYKHFPHNTRTSRLSLCLLHGGALQTLPTGSGQRLQLSCKKCGSGRMLLAEKRRTRGQDSMQGRTQAHTVALRVSPMCETERTARHFRGCIGAAHTQVYTLRAKS